MEIKKKWYDYEDYAFCELGFTSKKIILIHVLRYVYNHDLSSNQIYQVGSKFFIGSQTHAQESFDIGKIRVVPLFD